MCDFSVCVWEINSSVLDKLNSNDYHKHQIMKSNELGTDGKTGISADHGPESLSAITKRASAVVSSTEFCESSCV